MSDRRDASDPSGAARHLAASLERKWIKRETPGLTAAWFWLNA